MGFKKESNSFWIKIQTIWKLQSKESITDYAFIFISEQLGCISQTFLYLPNIFIWKISQ